MAEKTTSAGAMPRTIGNKEVGTTGIQYWGQNIYEEFLPNLQWPQAAKVYYEMAENDPTIGAVMYMSEQLIRKAGWSVDAVSDSPADKEAAEFLEECMHDMSTSWANTISEILSMFTYGWSLHEIVYKYRRGPQEKDPTKRSQYTDGRIGWRKHPIRSQHTLWGWTIDDDGGIKSMQQQASQLSGVVTIPLSKALLFRTKVVRDNPEGRSLIRSAYRPWYFKKRIEEIEGIGIERDLAGLPLLIPPENTDLWNPNNAESVRMKASAEAIVKSVRRDKSEGVVIPAGWDFKLLSTGGSRQFDTNAIINRYDQRIAITMLADIVMLGADKVGSFALAEVKKSLLAASLEAQINNIADIFNKYAVPKLFELNVFPGIIEFPKIKPGEVEVPSLTELGNFFKATGMKVDTDLELMNFLRGVASIPKMSEKDFAEYQRRQDLVREKTSNAGKETNENKPDGDKSDEELKEEEAKREGEVKEDA